MELTSNEKKIAMQAKSVEELLELAKGYEHPISREEAEEIYAELNKEGELADNDLEDIAGGSCYSKDPHGKLIVTLANKCDLFEHDSARSMGSMACCSNCKHHENTPSFTMYCKIRTKFDDPVGGKATIRKISTDYGPAGPVIQPMR